MSNCAVAGCKKSEFLPFKCRYCGRSFCGDHRLPANHDCPARPEIMNIPSSARGPTASFHEVPPPNPYGAKLCQCRADPPCDHKYVYECAQAGCKCCIEG